MRITTEYPREVYLVLKEPQSVRHCPPKPRLRPSGEQIKGESNVERRDENRATCLRIVL
jgi:hypothetical protein